MKTREEQVAEFRDYVNQLRAYNELPLLSEQESEECFKIIEDFSVALADEGGEEE